MVRVLIVDDSKFIRNTLTSILSKDENIEIVGTARDGIEAIDLIEKLNPDVVTLDIEMPKMNGIEALKIIMRKFPLPIIMVSTMTTADNDLTLKALEHGALDFILKNLESDHIDEFSQELIAKIKVIARRKSYLKMRFSNQHSRKSATHTKAPQILPKANLPAKGLIRYVVIGVSTGGPPAVQKILAALPENFPACILIAQHMPCSFTGSFAARLNSLSKITVKEAASGDPLKAGVAYVAPGGSQLILNHHSATKELLVTSEPKASLYKPSVNILFESIAQEFGKKVLGIILTGMGSDGAIGAKFLKEKGGYLIAQNEQSCVVYGMPKAIVDAGIADQIVDIDEMANVIMQIVH